MEFATWEPVYEAILADFGYSRAGDEAARDLLADVLGRQTGRPLDPGALSLSGTVAVVAPGPSLADEVDRARSADAVVAASDAADRLAGADVTVDVQVTDLDGDPDGAARRTREGTPVAVHAHGDNRDALRATVPDCRADRVLPTTQAAPVGPVCNVGGFTDGDRAAFLADALGAGRLRFVGWDVAAVTGPEKRRKLDWATRLLSWLERRRGERFAPLDGRRDDRDELPGR
jgi:uncharacterized Rossmann fold enzyme